MCDYDHRRGFGVRILDRCSIWIVIDVDTPRIGILQGPDAIREVSFKREGASKDLCGMQEQRQLVRLVHSVIVKHLIRDAHSVPELHCLLVVVVRS